MRTAGPPMVPDDHLEQAINTSPAAGGYGEFYIGTLSLFLNPIDSCFIRITHATENITDRACVRWATWRGIVRCPQVNTNAARSIRPRQSVQRLIAHG
jgi:hypothetical protein